MFRCHAKDSGSDCQLLGLLGMNYQLSRATLRLRAIWVVKGLWVFLSSVATLFLFANAMSRVHVVGQDVPAFVHEFVISMPEGVKLSHDGASNLPADGLLLKNEFQFPSPSVFSLPAGTVVHQEPGKGWDGLRFRLPTGRDVTPGKTELVGIEVRESVTGVIEQLFVAEESDVVTRCRSKLDRISNKTGQPPTLADFRHLVMSPPGKLTKQGYLNVQAHFIASQTPEITLKDLRLLRASLRDSIVTFRAEWQVTLKSSRSPDRGTEIHQAGKFSAVIDLDKMRHDTARGPTLDDLRIFQARSYDGTVERVVDGNESGRSAVIHMLISPAYYFDENHPLWLAKLIDTGRDLGRSQSGLENFQDRYAYPLEHHEHFHGRDCLALVEQETVYFLDPLRNYAYCGFESGRYSFHESEGRVKMSADFSEEVLDDFQDCGNGVWLPTRCLRTNYVNGKNQHVSEVIVSVMDVNKQIDVAIFRDVISDGVEVFDGTRGVAYIKGASRLLEDNLARSITPNSNRLVRRVFVFANLAAVLLGVCYVIWRFRTRWRR